MTPTPDERDALFESFARALFKRDMDGLCKVVSPEFVWRYHDGVSSEVVLTGRDAILNHLDEKKAFYATSHFTSMTWPIIISLTYLS
jgi:hypothetical protein